MKKSILSVMLMSLLLCGCANSQPMPVKEPALQAANTESSVDMSLTLDTNKSFEDGLVDYLNDKGWSDENYMVSATSYRAAVALAVAGADTQTKSELISALGFESEEELNTWYNSLSTYTTMFMDNKKQTIDDYKTYMSGSAKDCPASNWNFSVLNSIWNNTTTHGKFTKDYVNLVKSKYDAEAFDVKANEITDKINSWVDKNTNGMIPNLLADASSANAVLVNTVYLKTSFMDEFSEDLTYENDFTSKSGDVSKKEFMVKEDNALYYSDDDMRFVSLPMEGGIYLVVALGDSSPSSVLEHFDDTSYPLVHMEIPKIDTETAFDKKEMVSYLIGRGARLAFSDDADFSVMCADRAYKIDDIIQKTKIKLDEEGIEAAAATAVVMTDAMCAFEPEPEKPIEFICNEPFKYYVISKTADDAEIFFMGQMVQ